MSFALQRSTRNLRKRKRTEDDINNAHESKRRRKHDNFSERSASGFCQHCTNPYKLISCKQCYRSWHIKCLNKSILNNKTNEDQKHSDLILKNITINMPKLQLKNTLNHDIDATVREMKKAIEAERKHKYPNPIQLPTMPLKSSNISEKDYLNYICKWFKQITPSVINQETSHNNTHRKQIMALFDCSDCLNNTHNCFVCKSRTKLIESNEELPQKCNHRGCGIYYHKSCLVDDESYSKHCVFYANGGIKCPQHHCWSCFQLKETKYSKSARKTCWYCPRSYHRNCVPLSAELMSVQRTDDKEKLQTYPDFRFDLMTCCWNDEDKDIDERLNPIHPKPKDLQFGRDDVKSGIFKWKLWDNITAEFYRLDDDPFSIDIKMVNDYYVRERKQSLNPFPKNFKKIQKSRYSKNYKKPSLKPDYGRCSCVNGCALDWSCSNYGLEIECNDKICGSRDYKECKNRQFTRTKSNNVEVKRTNQTGFGAFAKVDLCSNQLIIEYVGEVLSKEESSQRIKALNEVGSLNFYFFQVDSKTVIDGTLYGNESRFLNHSCSANCYTMRWNVRGEDRLGIFASNDIKKGDELTYDYQYEVPNPDDIQNLAKCLCGTKECRIYLGFNKKKAKEWREQHPLQYGEERKKRKKKKKKKHRKKKNKGSKKKKRKKNKDKENQIPIHSDIKS